jgi:DNA-binding response OmpR family regulator
MPEDAERILLAEDDRFLRRAAEARLRQQGFEVLAATDGEEALRVARAERPDLVLLDVVMPRLQGFEVLKALKRDDVEQAIALGAEAYLVKAHLSLQDLVQKIDATLASEPA